MPSQKNRSKRTLQGGRRKSNTRRITSRTRGGGKNEDAINARNKKRIDGYAKINQRYEAEVAALEGNSTSKRSSSKTKAQSSKPRPYNPAEDPYGYLPK